MSRLGVVGLGVVLLAATLALSGCSSSETEKTGDLVGDVVKAYLNPANMPPRHAPPHVTGQMRCQKLGAALGEAIARHGEAPEATLKNVKELKELCDRAAEAFTLSAQQGGGGAGSKWGEAMRLQQEFEAKYRALPGVEEAMKKYEETGQMP